MTYLINIFDILLCAGISFEEEPKLLSLERVHLGGGKHLVVILMNAREERSQEISSLCTQALSNTV